MFWDFVYVQSETWVLSFVSSAVAEEALFDTSTLNPQSSSFLSTVSNAVTLLPTTKLQTWQTKRPCYKLYQTHT